MATRASSPPSPPSSAATTGRGSARSSLPGRPSRSTGAGFAQLGEERHVLFDFSSCSTGPGNFSSHRLPCITS
ncbi:hypothetical protein RchiOBHm_Chr4g0432521 [Rosa chinensis]|uniref:Uncharacterized protein n=1 Tax=Rosa chinensis TaxID=74649 RepID=A0A2P6R0Z5_ROSCH|nr:hypothetical protein RchiOBHm_Chr4g0432521 [Rosa chinensis]